MHIHFLDPYTPGASPVHRLDARIKLVLALCIVLAATLMPVGAWPAYILLFSLLLCVEMLSELGVRWVLKRSSLALPFVLAALPVIFTTQGSVLLHIPVGFGELAVTLPGVERFASIAIKSWLSVQAAVLLASTTQFPDLLVAMRALKVPRLLVVVFGLMWRYLFVLADEAVRLMRAREARSGQLAVPHAPGLKPGGSIAWRARVTGGMAGNLFLRSFSRADRIYAAMMARGYDGEVRTLSLPEVPTAQWAVLVVGVALLAGLLALSNFLG
jgi:cobalt/nickel transport system permease protein